MVRGAEADFREADSREADSHTAVAVTTSSLFTSYLFTITYYLNCLPCEREVAVRQHRRRD